MNFAERYDLIIESIEKNIQRNNQEITLDISRKLAIGLRSLGEGFTFITGETVAMYIRKRRMVHALQDMLNLGLSVESVAEKYGFADQPTFSKSCKALLGISPKRVCVADLMRFPALTLEQILKGAPDLMSMETLTDEKKNAFGTTANQFERIKETLDLNALYGFEDHLLELIYSISQSFQAPLTDAFEFMNDLLIYRTSLSKLRIGCYKYTLEEAALVYFNLYAWLGYMTEDRNDLREKEYGYPTIREVEIFIYNIKNSCNKNLCEMDPAVLKMYANIYDDIENDDGSEDDSDDEFDEYIDSMIKKDVWNLSIDEMIEEDDCIDEGDTLGFDFGFDDDDE
ncbi:MAG: helix-turn-helix transcriptional regulator [Clostridia bacterium]|nr:helix-turn-helix transcriptional regulator [Clostridia bacterium]